MDSPRSSSTDTSQPKKRLRLLEIENNQPTNRLKRFYGINEALLQNKQKRVKYTSPQTRLEEIASKASLSDLEKGHIIMDHIRANMDIVDRKWGRSATDLFVRSRDQRIFHEKIFIAMLKFVYGKAYAMNELKIKEYNMVSEKVKTALALTAPRRFGKSLSIAIAIAILFYTVPFMEICIIGQSSRAVNKKSGILGTIKEILSQCFDFDDSRYVTNDSENVIAMFPERRAIHAVSSQSGNRYVFFLLSVSFRSFILYAHAHKFFSSPFLGTLRK